MATLGNLESQMKSVENQLSSYDANLPSAIQGEIQRAYTPTLERALGQTRTQMSEFVPTLMNAFQDYGMGNTAYDLSPVQKLSKLGGIAGSLTGNIDSSQRLSDYLGGQMNDLYSKAVQAAQTGQQNLADKYNRLSQQYQMAFQAAEAEKDRALSKQLSSGSGSAGVDYSGLAQLLGGQQQTSIPKGYQDAITQIENKLTDIAKRSITKEQRRKAVDSTIDIFVKFLPSITKYIDPYKLYNMAGFSDKWNPALNNW